MSFANLKRNSGSSLEKLSKVVESMAAPNHNPDEEKYWKCTTDRSGNGYAIIRFLPAPPQDGDNGIDFIRYYDHGFQGPGGWYIQKSLTSIGKEDPVSVYNGKLWGTGLESDKDLARKQKRRLHYVSNIYVVKDSSNPENEGKTFLFAYGKKIFEKITQAMNPQFEDDVAFNPFDMWKGANFKLKIRKVDGYQNYDLSEFERPSPLSNNDDELELIWNSEHSLQEILDPKNFKSYEELERLLNKTLGNTSNTNKPPQEPKISNIQKKEKEIEETFNSSTDEDDENMDFFADLLNDED